MYWLRDTTLHDKYHLHSSEFIGLAPYQIPLGEDWRSLQGISSDFVGLTAKVAGGKIHM